MALKFGTSGVRGLVTEMTDRECFLYGRAFLKYVKSRVSPKTVALAGDHRASTTRIMRAVAFAIREEGMEVDSCGLVPTPALALHGMSRAMPGIMVTGSHVPADRNGIKFYMPWGEVLKEDEREISRRFVRLKEDSETGGAWNTERFAADGALLPAYCPDLGKPNPEAGKAYVERFLSFFPPRCLAGLKILFYQHSSVSRDILPDILRELGADVEKLGWSDSFVAVDTEAVEDPERLGEWVRDQGADALCSADGDGDRPLIVDEKGAVLRGDVLGILVADSLRARSVSTPVSCNTALEKCGRFERIFRTRIGSPFVVESMMLVEREGLGNVVGYEANGGFLTGTDMVSPDTGAVLKALPTRDAALPILALLHLSVKHGRGVSELASALPERHTFSGLLRPFPTEQGQGIVEAFREKGKCLADAFFAEDLGPVKHMDFTDGARMVFASEDIVHIRPSGNAPELRCYTESSSEVRARELNRMALWIIHEGKAT